MQYIELSKVKGADYNPRHLNEDAKERLRRSISELGIVKPIIVRKENSTIIAGHQRTMTMKALGYESAPAYVLSGVNKADEIRFNQMHNGYEVEVAEDEPTLYVNAPLKVGEFQRISNQDVEVRANGKAGYSTTSLCALYVKYGEFGCPICDPRGKIVVSSCYAFAVKKCGGDMDVLCLDYVKAQLAVKYLSQSYGEYSYENIEKHTWHQAFAQMKRTGAAKEDGTRLKKGLGSVLYEGCVIPYLNKIRDKKSVRILDFGAGRYEYATTLKMKGWNITAVDPYHQVNGRAEIDVKGVTSTYLRICKDIQTYGFYDIVICDSVLNSVDTMESWFAVVNTCAALCKMGGVIFIAGRDREKQEKEGKGNKVNNNRHYLYYYDKDGFSALYRNKDWFFQKFDSKEEVKGIGELIGEYEIPNIGGSCWKMKAIKTKQQPLDVAINALRHEWNMPLPNNRSYGLSDDIEIAYRNAIQKWKWK